LKKVLAGFGSLSRSLSLSHHQPRGLREASKSAARLSQPPNKPQP
jgi:hypothetical protein